MPKDLSFLTGTENFSEIIEEGAYYVDKTSYLKTLFLSSYVVKNPLFIRPRRFGKTLNMSMIKEFCELNYQNPKDKSRQQKLFIDNGRNLAVAGVDYQDLREKIMGEFPVISISFKGVEGNTFVQALSSLLKIIAYLYKTFFFLSNSARQIESDKKIFMSILEFSNEEFLNLYDKEKLTKAVAICETFIPTLAEMLFKEYDRKVIVMIDEYDVPLQKAVVAEEPYYNKMLEIIRKLSVSTFKQSPDPWLYKGIVTGCLRIAHQSVFTDANNFTTYGMSDDPYTGFFGFTKEETEKLLEDSGLTDKADKVREWYDGYRFGDEHIYCPWSLVNYCYKAKNKHDTEPKAFWVNSSGNDIINLYIKNSMEAHDAGNIEKLQALMDGRSVEISLEEFTTYPDIKHKVSFDVFMTLMLHTGYVTYSEDSGFNNQIKIRIPNREVYECFKAKQEMLYGEDNQEWFNQALRLVDLLMENNVKEAASLINSMLKQFLSVRNYGSELYYHGFMLGVIGLAASTRSLTIHEELESGDGFTDLILDNFDDKTCCILELKKAESLGKCINAAQAATEQIITKNYAEEFIGDRYERVYGIGIGFAKKSCEIISLGNLADKEH